MENRKQRQLLTITKALKSLQRENLWMINLEPQKQHVVEAIAALKKAKEILESEEKW